VTNKCLRLSNTESPVFPKKKIQTRAWQQLRNVAVKWFKMMCTYCYMWHTHS